MLSEVSGEMLCYRKERPGGCKCADVFCLRVDRVTCTTCAAACASVDACLAAVRLSTPLMRADSFVIGALDEVCVSVCRGWGSVWG